jgi:hypothetical protein
MRKKVSQLCCHKLRLRHFHEWRLHSQFRPANKSRFGLRSHKSSKYGGSQCSFWSGTAIASFFVAEALFNPTFQGYDLTPLSPAVGGSPNFQPQTFSTDAGFITFLTTASLTFQAVSGVPKLSTWGMMLFGIYWSGLHVFSARAQARSGCRLKPNRYV